MISKIKVQSNPLLPFYVFAADDDHDILGGRFNYAGSTKLAIVTLAPSGGKAAGPS
jgi:hypothetical protein